jgi:hypothetical protein
MKKIAIFFFIVICATSAVASTQPSFSVGLGALEFPGLYDPVLLSKLDSLHNNAGVTLVNPTTPEPQSILGFNGFAQVTWFGFMARAGAMIGYGRGLTYSYDEAGVRVSVDDRLLLVAGTLWVGPILEVPEIGAVYVCLGPTYLYGEYRDKQTVEGIDASSWDRQYAGGGFALPVMVGAEARPLPWLGIGVEVGALSQQVVVTTSSKENLAAAGVTNSSMLVPSMFYGFMPAVFWAQLQVSLHF